MNISRCSSKAFTLVELMITVAIIAILATAGIPQFANLLRKSKEASTKGGLTSFRSALSIYVSDNEGNTPWFGNDGDLVSTEDLPMLVPTYADKIPSAKFGTYHSDRDQIIVRSSGIVDRGVLAAELDVGGWIYSSWGGGSFFVDCSHTDSRNIAFTTW